VKAIIKAEAGEGNLAWTDWPEPTPRPGQVVVDIKQAGICSTDVAIYSGTYSGRRPIEFPSMLGHEAAGVVSEVSEGIDDVRIGDRVALQVIWGHPHARQSLLGFENLDPDWFHIGASALGGAFAERIAVEADRIVLLPDSIAWEDAALVEPVAVAAHAMELVALRAGETFVVVGPGPFGLLMCQIARSSGAARVVVVGLEGIDEARLEVARRAGADDVLTFAGDTAATASEIATLTGEGADVVMDCGGTPDSTFLALEAAAPAGRVAMFGFTREARIEPLRQVIRKGLSLYGVSAAQRRHYGLALRMIEASVARPREIVSHRLPMSRAAEGIELMKARAASKILLELPGESQSLL
jgi:threonine dehydrogenase-like Zn-dependent dehydrogenase